VKKHRKRARKSSKRTSSGRLPRARAARTGEPGGLGPSKYMLRRRADALAEVIRVYPGDVALGLAARDEAGWHFGRLYLIGAINMYQYAAAQRLDWVTRRYRRMLVKHGHVSAVDTASAGTRTSGEDLSEEAQRRMGKARRDYDQMYDILSDCPAGVREAVVGTLERDALTDLDLLRQGLDALAVVV